MTDMWFWFWVVSASGLILAEIFTQTFFKGAFGVSAAVSALLAYLEFSPDVQLGVFLLLALPLLLLARKLATSSPDAPPQPIAAERLLGQVGVVIHPIGPHGSGLVKVGTEEWTAHGEFDVTVGEGAEIEVVRIDGVRLIVRPRAS